MTTGTRREPADLLALTPERFRRALWRSFLRCGVTGDLDTAVHAAMVIVGPVLEARDTEISRLRAAVSGAAARPSVAAARLDATRRRDGAARREGGARRDNTVVPHRTRRDRPA
jgi:hypothetical protein